MIELSQIDRIKIKLRLAKNTDSFFEVFGSSSHKYFLDKPLELIEVEQFECEYNIMLPEGYKKFISEIGNGGINYENSVVGNSGAGPNYGIFKLGHPYQFISDPSLKYLEQQPFLTEETTDEIWEYIYLKMEDNISDEDYEIEIAKAYAGILNIGYAGCSEYLGIIVNGKNKGKIIDTYDEIEYCPCFYKENDFLDWYENWLDTIISGKKIKESGFTNETEESCINRFLSDKESYWKFVSLSSLRNFDKLNKSSIKTLKNKYNTEKDEKVRLYILNLLTKFDYDNTKKEIATLHRKEPLEFLRNIHLFAQEKSVEWKNEIDIIRNVNFNNQEIIEYIKYIFE
ncbi:MAG TPA: SMI1/KNR4 family protein [Chitinophagales bacterium]|nr:SMI1/KNR4 family protein [Chitinophagales bacterium]